MTLKLYAHECVDVRIVFALRAQGVDIVNALELGLLGAEDAVHAERAAALGRIVVTADTELRPLAQALQQLDDQELELVISAVRCDRSGCTIPWEELRGASGIASVGGGNAVADCDALYDDA